MNYERKYKEALERAKDFFKANQRIGELEENDVLSDIFPELKENENEKIRKGIIKSILDLSTGWLELHGVIKKDAIAWLEKQGKQSSNILWHDVSEEPDEKREIFCEWKSSTGIWYAVVFYHADSKTFWEGERIVTNVLKWTYVNEMLEKQGEQKPVDKVESIFEVGNWYQCTKDFFGKGVTFDKNTAYYCAKEGCLQDEYGCHIAIVKNLYDNFKLWTIEDAKDGDVLVSVSNQPFIYNGKFTEYTVGAYCGTDVYGDFVIEKDIKEIDWTSIQDIRPATKEQRDLLFQKMKEEGYEWDENAKKLIKL